MKDSKSESTKVNRRRLFTQGGAAAAGIALAATAGNAEAAAPAAAKVGSAGSSLPNMTPPVIQVQGGKLRGFRDGKTLTFLGVRYAEADRFEMPKPVKPWEGVKNAQTWGPVCPIPPASNVGGDDFVFPHRYWVENEHCQVLNIWTQNASPSAKKPVMVWMHGGGFTNGSSMESYAYDGKCLSEFGDVVAVSVNHRLNIIGTLDLSAYGPDYALSRHTGMADLVAALQWVHDNIEAFGGDPGNVTIFGQSGGGGKVSRLMFMPAAKGLFHKVIAQSGGALNYRSTDPAKVIAAQQAVAAETLKNLNLTGNDIDKFKKVPYRDLLAAGNAALQTLSRQQGGGGAPGGGMGWNPVADDQYVMREICDWAHSIPYMAGTVLTEFTSNYSKSELDKNEWTGKQVDEKLTSALGGKKDAAVAEFKKLYPRKKVQDVLYVDSRFRPGAKNMLALKLEKATAPVYNYMFTYEYPVNGGVTAFHCSEIAFAFHALSEPHIRIATGGSPAALALQDKVSQAWVNFARSGNPSQPGLAWKPYTVAGREAMVFDEVSECRSLNDDQLLAQLPQAARPRG